MEKYFCHVLFRAVVKEKHICRNLFLTFIKRCGALLTIRKTMASSKEFIRKDKTLVCALEDNFKQNIVNSGQLLPAVRNYVAL